MAPVQREVHVVIRRGERVKVVQPGQEAPAHGLHRVRVAAGRAVAAGHGRRERHGVAVLAAVGTHSRHVEAPRAAAAATPAAGELPGRDKGRGGGAERQRAAAHHVPAPAGPAGAGDKGRSGAGETRGVGEGRGDAEVAPGGAAGQPLLLQGEGAAAGLQALSQATQGGG